MEIVIPEDIALAAQITEEYMLLEISIFLLKNGRISLEEAGTLAKMAPPELLELLTHRLISTPYNAADVQKISHLRRLGW